MTSPKTGLFSATVAAFIIEFYKQLDPGSDSSTAGQPSLPTGSMIWVDAMWLVSLVLSLTSALVVTFLQQWALRYIETPNNVGRPERGIRRRTCSRAFVPRHEEVQNASCSRNNSDTPSPLRMLVFWQP